MLRCGGRAGGAAAPRGAPGRRCFSATAVALKSHSARYTSYFSNHWYHQGLKSRFIKVKKNRPDPINGCPGNQIRPDHMHPWDYWGNAYPVSTFGERGIAANRHVAWHRRNRQFVYCRWAYCNEMWRETLFRPMWSGSNGFQIQPHLQHPPGSRPGCDWPTSWNKEYSGWFEMPHLKSNNPMPQSEDMTVRYARDRAQKLENVRFILAASNWQVSRRSKWEAGGGPMLWGPKREHASGGNAVGAPPSPLGALWGGARGGGDLFTDQAGPGTFPLPHTRGGKYK